MRKVHQELSRGILADILLAEREGRGSEAAHELRNERQLAKRNVLPRKKQHCEEDAKESRSRPFLGGSSFNDSDGTTQTARDPLEGGPACVGEMNASSS